MLWDTSRMSAHELEHFQAGDEPLSTSARKVGTRVESFDTRSAGRAGVIVDGPSSSYGVIVLFDGFEHPVYASTCCLRPEGQDPEWRGYRLIPAEFNGHNVRDVKLTDGRVVGFISTSGGYVFGTVFAPGVRELADLSMRESPGCTLDGIERRHWMASKVIEAYRAKFGDR